MRRLPGTFMLLVASPMAIGCGSRQAVPRGIETTESMLGDRIYVTSRTVLYTVNGDSLGAVRERMRRIGPLDGGSHQSAFTWINLAWSYPFARSEAGCRTGTVLLDVEVVQTFPEWSAPAGVSAAGWNEWRRWLEATRAHEEKHREIGLDAARQLGSALDLIAQKTFPTCEDVDRAAGEVGAAQLRDMREKHRAYDEETKHGETTGAVLRDVSGW